jgi:protein SCO1/2
MRTSIFAGLALAFAAACHDPTSTTTTSSAAGRETVVERTPSPSIYPLELALRDQTGATIRPDAFRGHPVVVSMFYGSCPAACPLIVTHIKQIEASLPAEVRADTRVLLVSFDAERDDPAALSRLASAHRVDVARWRFAAAPEDDARQLANAIGVHYRNEGGGVFSHDSVIAVLDREGRIVASVDDPAADLEPLVKSVVAVSR